jgi:hypothetical protein
MARHVLVRAAMSRLRIEALLTAVLAACGGSTESGNGAPDVASSSSSSGSSGSTAGTSTSSSSGATTECNPKAYPYTETKTYDLPQACSEYEAHRASMDAGADADAGEDAGAFECSTLTCEELCRVSANGAIGFGPWNGTASDCEKTTTELSCTFHRPCGRRFAGMEEPTTNDVLAGSAYLEAASVIAFEHLARDLAFHEAPFHLLEAALRAADDERRHTAMVHALAGGPWPEPNATEWKPRALVDIALENVVEGCVGETWGALVALAQARDARSPEVRAAFASIASDEIDHAALAHELDAWVRPLLSHGERAAVLAAKKEAWARFAIDIDPAIARELGIPNGDASRRMLEALEASA